LKGEIHFALVGKRRLGKKKKESTSSPVRFSLPSLNHPLLPEEGKKGCPHRPLVYEGMKEKKKGKRATPLRSAPCNRRGRKGGRGRRCPGEKKRGDLWSA